LDFAKGKPSSRLHHYSVITTPFTPYSHSDGGFKLTAAGQRCKHGEI